MSIGFFIAEDEAVVWRGPMLHKALTQFLEDVAWGELDFLLIDLPPGTGDVSMTLAQLLPQAKFVLVTTPQAAAQKVARRAAEMADKVNLEIAGVIENMSGFTTPAGERFAIFGEGGGQLLADELDVPLIGKVPLTMPLRETVRRRHAAGRDRSRRPGRPGDPPGRARDRRDDAGRAADHAGPAGRAAAGGHEPPDGRLIFDATSTSSTRGSRWSAATGRTPYTVDDYRARRPRVSGSPAAPSSPARSRAYDQTWLLAALSALGPGYVGVRAAPADGLRR